jgi:hypothetical protein
LITEHEEYWVNVNQVAGIGHPFTFLADLVIKFIFLETASSTWMNRIVEIND